MNENGRKEKGALNMKTDRGVFRRDRSGLYHYEHLSGVGSVFQATADAIKYRPKSAAWFWFNETPAPIYFGDSANDLVRR